MDPPAPPPGRHRATGRPTAAGRAGGDHRAPVPEPGAAEPPGAEPGSGGPALADLRAAGMARFLAAAREQSASAPPSARRRGPSRPQLPGWRTLLVAVVLVGVVGVGWALHRPAHAAPAPRATAARAANVPLLQGRSPGPASTAATTGPTATSPVTSRSGGALAAPAASAAPAGSAESVPAESVAAGAGGSAGSLPAGTRPPTTVRAIPVVPVPATASPAIRAGPSADRRGAGSASWRSVVTALLATRAGAFAAGRPAMLRGADAPGSALLRTDGALFTRVLTRAGYTRAAGLAFDLDGVRLLHIGTRSVRFAVTGRQGAYVLLGPGRSEAVAAGPRRALTIELSRASPAARWLLAAGAEPGGR